MSGVWLTVGEDVLAGVATTAGAALLAYVSHRTGWLGKPLGAVAGWLRAEGGTLGDEAVVAIEQAVTDALRGKQPTPAPAAAPTVLQGDAGFRPVPHPTPAHVTAGLATYPDRLPDGTLVMVAQPVGAPRQYTVESSEPAAAGGWSYRLRASADNPGVNEGDTTVPGGSRG